MQTKNLDRALSQLAALDKAAPMRVISEVLLLHKASPTTLPDGPRAVVTQPTAHIDESMLPVDRAGGVGLGTSDVPVVFGGVSRENTASATGTKTPSTPSDGKGQQGMTAASSVKGDVRVFNDVMKHVLGVCDWPAYPPPV